MNAKEIIRKGQTTNLVNAVSQLYSETNEKFKSIIKKYQYPVKNKKVQKNIT